MLRLRSRFAAAAGLFSLAAFALAACSPVISLEPAANADDPLCAEVSVRYPDELAGQARVWTDAQATASWGSPTAVVVSCGVEPPGPTTLPCQTVGSVDWIIDDSDAPRYLVTSFGRTPAVQVYLDNEAVSSLDVLDALSPAVSRLPVDGQCTERSAGE